ncbi:glycosyltransferase family 9 protein [Engelhardtia mirabilis]|uniref:ADP-heptose--LPS heptosyltransferase 2 n=1 Tax=Engelhardtia mirabilis TaxID=2528011 RepID=A0A518BPK6_9BACT|nr:ADP-heptose--LPS heptosyltransferase 2 [Planctomycetes bacterium Pla133]QDV03241.1 ADP-heptose--LPS heptosyltransferase 2 [Planctomycetes bacterium Pla86]
MNGIAGSPDAGGTILVRLPSWLGDLVAVEPALRALAARRGGDDGRGLSLAAPAHLLPLLDGWLPGARRIPHPGRGGERAADWRGHDVALLLTGSFRSAWTALRAGIPRRVGWARDGRGLLLTDAIAPARELGAVPLGLGVRGAWPRWLPRSVTTSSIELVSLLGVSTADPVPRLRSTATVSESVALRLAAAGIEPGERPVVANVGGRPGSAKAWTEEAWIAALAALDPDLPLVLVAGPGEEAALEAVASGLTRRARPPLCAWGERAADLPELLALCARACVVLSTDAGPRHVARAAGASTVVLFGPTDPRHTACPGPPSVHLRREVDCAPCHLELCPRSGSDHRLCTALIDPREVAAAAQCLIG